MADRFFLNALTTRNRQLPVPAQGTWQTDDAFLKKYSRDIRLEGDLADRDVVPSLPSVFARPIQFYQALADGRHPLHRAVVEQWRGLLGVIALRDLFKMQVEVKKYIVPEQRQAAEAERVGVGGARDLHLTTILRNQLPHQASDWETWWLVYCNGELIGATSPWSVFYTPADYRCPDSVPWQKDGLLADPVHYYAAKGSGRRPEMALLLRWVELVLEHQRWGMPDRLEEQFGAVRRALEEWKNDLDAYRDRELVVPGLKPGRLRVADDPYRHFVQIPDAKPGTALDSDFKLTDPQGNEVLALSRTALEGGRVFGVVFVDQLDLSTTAMPGPVSEGAWETPNGQQVPIPYVFAEEAFLPSKLVGLSLSEEALQCGSSEYALPLTSLFFQYVSYEDLVNDPAMLRIETLPAGDVQVDLSLTLSGGRKLEVTKRYDHESEVVSVEGTPALAVWPDFYSTDWLENFALLTTPETDLVVAPLLGDGSTLERSVEGGVQRPTRIWQCDTPVIGFSVYGNGGSGELEELGVILRSSFRQPAEINDSLAWKVAVDFGTSSTHVMVDDGRGEVRPLYLEGRTRILTEQPVFYRQAVITALYPEQGINTPFPTILAHGDASMIHQGVAGRGGGQFAPQFQFFPESAGDVTRFVENVKWGSGRGTAEDVPIREYLRGLVRYIACEARAKGIRKLVFEWSYPLSLPSGARHALRTFWQGVGSEAIEHGVMIVGASSGISESEAACRYLASMPYAVVPIRARTLSIAVDVGGGSSDIGFWTETRLLDQVSFKLAANDLFGPMAAHSSLLYELFKICAHQDDQDRAEASRKRGAIICNALLTTAKDRAGRPHTSPDPKHHPVVRGLQAEIPPMLPGERPWLEIRSMAYLFFSGLSFYLGLHSRSLKEQSREVNIYFGGRGSSLLSWVGRGTSDLIREALKYAFKEGCQQADRQSAQADRGAAPPEIDVSFHGPAIDFDPRAQPKDETVRGLLSKPVDEDVDAVATKLNTVVLGEIGWSDANGDEVQWNARLTTDELRKLQPPPNFESGHMAHFRDQVLPRYVEDFGLDAERLANLTVNAARVQDHLRKEATQLVLQPVFGSELKALLDAYVQRIVSA